MKAKNKKPRPDASKQPDAPPKEPVRTLSDTEMRKVSAAGLPCEDGTVIHFPPP